MKRTRSWFVGGTIVRYDEIGYWTEVKLQIVEKYATAYSTIMQATPVIRKHLYIDAFAGAGKHIAKKTGNIVSGSPAIALKVEPPFSQYHFIDLDGGRVKELQKLAGGRSDVKVHEGDCNKILLDEVFPLCRFEDYCRALCLLDPYSINVDWEVLQTAGKMGMVEVFYNFMIMDANMNVFWRNPDKVEKAQIERMDRAWGDHSWRDVAYKKEAGLFGDIEEKADNKTIAEAFRKRLLEIAGFKYVPDPMPMRNSNGAVIYYLYFASQNKTGSKIVNEIFHAYRNKGAC
jgi:three-Cys-motif partner protein